MPEIEQLLLNKTYFANIKDKQYMTKIKDNIYCPKIGDMVDYALIEIAEPNKDVCYYEEYESSYKTWEPIIPVGPPIIETPPEEPEIPPEEINILYLYDKGDNTAITGGWTPYGEQDLDCDSQDTGTQLKIQGYVGSNSAVPTGSNTCLRTTNLINFTDYKILTIHFNSITKAGNGADNTGWGLNTSASTERGSGTFSTSGSDITLTFDITDVKEAYLSFFVINHSVSSRNAPSIYIDQIYIEK